jgi:UDP-2,3-diacylglucosamine pyrophosphatase LpxH
MSINSEELFDDIENQEFNGILVIGDTHFRMKHLSEGEAFVQRVVEIAVQKSPTAIVLLGDILDTHETAKVQPFKLACRFIEDLSGIAPTYVLMGNHDLMNQSQFCTDNHFFNPLKKWENVFIIDVPQIFYIGDKKMIMCPYVPPGRFIEALNFLDENYQTADCIFAHQEFKGADMSAADMSSDVMKSSKGDDWGKELPPVISGHIHKPHCLNGNIFYLGSAMQISFDELPNKKLNILTFNDEASGAEALIFEKIDLGLKGKLTLDIGFDELNEINFEEYTEKYFLKIKITGEQQQFKHLKSSDLYKRLVNNGVKITFQLENRDSTLRSATTRTKPLTFKEALREMVRDSEDKVQNAYKEVFSEDPNFEEEEDEEDGDSIEKIEVDDSTEEVDETVEVDDFEYESEDDQ